MYYIYHNNLRQAKCLVSIYIFSVITCFVGFILDYMRINHNITTRLSKKFPIWLITQHKRSHEFLFIWMTVARSMIVKYFQ